MPVNIRSASLVGDMEVRIEIREATIDDAEAIASVQVSAWQTAYKGMIPDRALAEFTVAERTKRWKRILAASSRDTLVAESNRTLIGWAGFGRSRDDDRSIGTAEMFGLYVDPAYWRIGAGGSLWRASVERLNDRGYRRMDVWVLKANKRARQFYEAVGCELDSGVQKLFEGDGYSAPEVRYTVSLV